MMRRRRKTRMRTTSTTWARPGTHRARAKEDAGHVGNKDIEPLSARRPEKVKEKAGGTTPPGKGGGGKGKGQSKGEHNKSDHGGKGGFQKACFNCGQVGHLARDCPNRQGQQVREVRGEDAQDEPEVLFIGHLQAVETEPKEDEAPEVWQEVRGRRKKDLCLSLIHI